MTFRSIGVAAVVTLVASCSTTPPLEDATGSSNADVQTTRDGAFTAAQAERGREVYDVNCASCHPAEFYDAQLLIWQDATVGELLEALRATMPSESPGMLATSEYVDVLAYILAITGSPAGERELTIDNAGGVRIVNQ